MKRDYFEGADVAVTICAKDGTILDMNQKSKKTFLKPGREELIGHNVLDCHPDPTRSMLEDMLHNPRTNVYTVEKEGDKIRPLTATTRIKPYKQFCRTSGKQS